MSQPIRILVADDQPLLRELLTSRLAAVPDFEIVGAVGDGDTALATALATQPDVALLDIDMPGQPTFAVARALRTRQPATRVLILSGHTHDRYVEEAVASGVAGYMTKGEATEAVIGAIRTVLAGGRHFSEDVQARLLDRAEAAGPAAGATPRTRLSRRELDVLRCVARGMSNKEVGVELRISHRTVDRHICRLMNRLDIHDRVSLARYAIRERLVDA